MQRVTLIVILILALAVAVTGIGWGLPSRQTDRYLFQDREPWSGRRLVELKGSDWHQRRGLGADVDIDPVADRTRPIDLTATDRSRAEILVRYRLYTHQPDEASPLRALAGMRPARLQFDPKLYQYGGLFIYPVGALIRLGVACGLLNVRSDLAWGLDHPDQFAAMYVVLRGYSAAFGLLGVLVCYAVGRRLGADGAGVLAGILFILMPVVVTMSHEGKPHLPGAVLMLLAGLAGIQYMESGRSRHWWSMAVFCGLATAMVLSAWPVLAVIVVAAAQRTGASIRNTLLRLLTGTALALAVFFLLNPYLLINLFVDPDVVRSNLGTSTGMYAFGDLGRGAWAVASLLLEGMGPALAVVGTVSVIVLLARRTWTILPLVVPAGIVLVQFACIGAGKPGEYGRFLVFPSAVLAIAAAWGALGICRRRPANGLALLGVLLVGTGLDGFRYVSGFIRDSGPTSSRMSAAEWLGKRLATEPNVSIGVLREPAPYCTPPLDVGTHRVILLPERRPADSLALPGYVVTTADRTGEFNAAWWADAYEKVAVFPAGLDRWLTRPTVISWADKPVLIFKRRDVSTRPSR